MPDFTLAIISFAVAIAAILGMLHLAPRLGLLDKPDQRKLHDGAVPVVGGLALYVMLMALFLSGVATSSATAALLIAATFVTLIGAIDDRQNVSPRWRLLMQFIVSLILVYGADLRIEHVGSISFSGERVYLGPFATVITVLCIMSIINAMNFIDGLDGLAGGLVLIAVTGLWIAFSMSGNAVPDLVPVIAGGLTAFMLFNARWFGRKKAALFLGDAGSTLLGLLLAWLMIDNTQGANHTISPVVALWLVAIPVIDLFAITSRRIAMGRSPFHPDREHLHHILKRVGHTDKQTVAIIHVSAIAFASFGILGQIYNGPKNIMFYLFVALFFVTYYALKHSWIVAKLLKKIEQHHTVIELQHPVAETIPHEFQEKQDKAA